LEGATQAKQKVPLRERATSKRHDQETRSSPTPLRAARSETEAEATAARRVEREELKREDLSLKLQVQSLKEEKLSRQQNMVLKRAELSLLKRSRGALPLKGWPVSSEREHAGLRERLKGLQGRLLHLQQQVRQTQDRQSSQEIQKNHDVLRQEVRQLREALQGTRKKQEKESEKLDLEEKIENRRELQRSKREGEELRTQLLGLQGKLRLLALERRRDVDLRSAPREEAPDIAPPSPDRKAEPTDRRETSSRQAEPPRGARVISPSHSASVDLPPPHRGSEETVGPRQESLLRPRTTQWHLREREPTATVAHKKDRYALYRAHKQETLKSPNSRKMKLVRVTLPHRKSKRERPTRAASSAQALQKEFEDPGVLQRMDEEIS
jgi:hypothetical protein